MNNDYFGKIKENWGNIAKILFLTILLTLLFTFAQTLKYEASTSLLVFQNSSGTITDLYTLSKSNQYLSDILSTVVYSSTFMDSVLKTEFGVIDDFSSDPVKRKKEWSRMVSAKSNSSIGAINISVYHKNRVQAERIAQAISYILKNNHAMYHGSGDRVQIRTIDDVIVSKWPKKPNVVTNVILAGIFGLLFGFMYVYYFPNHKIRIFKKKKKDKDNVNNNTKVETRHIERKEENLVQRNLNNVNNSDNAMQKEINTFFE